VSPGSTIDEREKRAALATLADYLHATILSAQRKIIPIAATHIAGRRPSHQVNQNIATTAKIRT